MKHAILFSLLMAFLISSTMSFVMTAINVGFNEIFMRALLMNLLIGFTISAPVSFFAFPLVNKIVTKLLGEQI